ncbi:DUF5133 domain-containing protein [Streptomyces sp. NPDC048258]|uniref:DUF5133 domain-containing protein n=1 Tax=Streptomyces sp. NPDC048258 TaxID=3365527 RepID=UPI003711896D
MAATPCTASAAREILDAAASMAAVTARQMVTALVERSRGGQPPRRIERALRLAVEAARAPVTEPSCALLPGLGRVTEVLDRFRISHARLRADPSGAEARQALDDAAYTLCVMMGRRTAHQALREAGEYVATHPDS